MCCPATLVRVVYLGLLIPVYFGDPKSTKFDTEKLSAVVISVKNKLSPSSLQVTDRDIDFFTGRSQPVVAILLDLGVEPLGKTLSQLQLVRHPNRPPCYSFRLQGADSRTFGILDHQGLDRVCGAVLGHSTPKVDNNICQLNVFKQHYREKRFPHYNI